jgi:hypothetical protein
MNRTDFAPSAADLAINLPASLPSENSTISFGTTLPKRDQKIRSEKTRFLTKRPAKYTKALNSPGALRVVLHRIRAYVVQPHRRRVPNTIQSLIIILSGGRHAAG